MLRPASLSVKLFLLALLLAVTVTLTSCGSIAGTVYDSSGAGVPKDEVRAYAWFSIAINGGDAAAQQNRDALDKRLTPEQKAGALKLSQELSDKIRR